MVSSIHGPSNPSYSQSSKQGASQGNGTENAKQFDRAMSNQAGASPNGGSAGAGTRAPKRTADDAGLPDRTDTAFKLPLQRPDPNSKGTYGDREHEKTRLGIPTGSGTHQSEHTVPFGALHSNRPQKSTEESAMPAYHEATPLHRAHAGTGPSSKDSEARLDKTGWPSSKAYRNDQRTALQDPVARQEGTSLSNATQLNQLGYGQQRAHEARQNPGQPLSPPNQKASNSYDNTIAHDPGLKHDVPGLGTVTDHLGPRGQAEAVLARETQISGQYPTVERENEVRKHFASQIGNPPG